MTQRNSRTYPPQVKVGVGVVLVHRPTQTFLLGHRQNSLGHDTWALPGGHLEFGETFEDCAAREVEEETGIEVAAVAVAADGVQGNRGLRYWTTVNSVMAVEGKQDGAGEKRHYVTIFMVASVQERDGGRVQAEVREPEKCKAWEWVSWDDLKGWAEDTNQSDGVDGERKKLFQPMRDLLIQRKGLVPQGL